MKDEIKKAVIEMGDLLIGARIDKIWQLDTYTFLFSLYSLGRTFYLVLSVRKSSRRFHLVFEKIYRGYLLSTSTTDLLKKYLTGGRVTGIVIDREVVEIRIFQLKHYRLTADFLTLNVVLFDDREKLLYALHRRSSLSTVVITSDSIVLSEKKIRTFPALPISAALSQEFFMEREQALKKDILRVLRSEEKKLLKLDLKLTSEKEEIEQKERYRNIGEIIKYNLSMIPKGVRSASVRDFHDGEVLVELDPVLSPKKNMEAYFQKYRKLKKREKVIDANLSAQKEKLSIIHRLMGIAQEEGRISLLSSPENLFKSIDTSLLGKRFLLKLDHLRRKFLEPNKKRDVGRGRYLQFTSRSGKRILVGRSAEENEEISLRVARGNDLWFHAESVPGSHVILQYEGNGQFLEEDINDAAQLALYFSKMRREEKGNVQYTRCKYLRKSTPRTPGMVTFYNEKTKWTTLDQQILSELLRPQ